MSPGPPLGPAIDPTRGGIEFRAAAAGGWRPSRVWYHLREFGADPTFGPEGGHWVARIPRPPVNRLEYLLEYRHSDGGTTLGCDPENPVRVPGVFGEKSELRLPEYRPPWWLDAPIDPDPAARPSALDPGGMAVPEAGPLGIDLAGTWTVATARNLAGGPVLVHRPPADPQFTVREARAGIHLTGILLAPRDCRADEPLPLLLVHDGPEYAQLAALLRYLAVLRRQDPVLRCRVLLLHPINRDRSYSASPGYARALADRLLPELRAQFAVRGPVVGMGASLGGLAMLHTAITHPGSIEVVLSQSGSVFRRSTDTREAGHMYFDRIADFVDRLRTDPSQLAGIRLALTCGTGEENLLSNRRLHRELVRAGVAATLLENPDGHTFIGWRDCLDPMLTGLLREVWGALPPSQPDL